MQAETRRSRRLFHLLFENPVTVKELRSRMRGARGFVVLTLYLFLLSGFISLVYFAYAAAANQPFGPDPRQAGKPILGTVVAIQVLLVTVLAPAFTTGTISGEKERQTYDLLRTTLLSANSLVFGKLLSALSFVVLLVLTTPPIESIAFLLGGVSPAEVIISQLLILVAAVAYALVGLFFSTVMRTSLAATVSTYVVSLILTLGLPAFFLLIVGFIGSLIFSSTLTWFQEAILAIIGLFLAAMNLPAALIVSEIFLIQESGLFFITETMGGHTVLLPSPWWMFLVLYTLLSLVLYWACVRIVRRVATK
jgi:ABC-type transport system involved in multi-copper enzyme maturation permease subunit